LPRTVFYYLYQELKAMKHELEVLARDFAAVYMDPELNPDEA
jgi:hypothetical protein